MSETAADAAGGTGVTCYILYQAKCPFFEQGTFQKEPVSQNNTPPRQSQQNQNGIKSSDLDLSDSIHNELTNLS